MKNKSKYRIVHVVDDVFYGTYYKVQKWERHLLFFHWWTNICFYKRYNKNNNLDPYWWDCRYKTYDEAKDALDRYKNCEDFYYQKTVYKE